MDFRTMTSAAALAAALAVGAAPAFAQQAPDGTRPVPATPDQTADASAPAPADEAPGEIVVTAQKRSERLQDVPVAVSVVSGDALAAQGKPSLEGAQYLVPTLNFQKSGTTLNQSLFLRGVGTATFSIAGEPSVSTVIDGVVFSRAGEAFSDLVDIDQLEVLRGPQGTLFGKNASAGVINIITKQPTRDFGGFAEAGFFTRSEYRGRAAVNVPLSETLRTRFTGFYSDYDGNIRNVTTGNRVNGFRHYGGRAQAVWEPSDVTKLTFIADYHKNDDDCCADVISTTPLTAAGVPTTNASSTVLPVPRGDNTRQVAQDLVTRTKETGYGFSAQGDFTLGTQTVTTITAYRNYKNTEIRDGDFLPAAYVGFNQLHDFGPQTGNTFSQEIRLTSPRDQFLSYVVGAYYSRAESERIFTRNDIVCNTTPATTPNPLVRCGSAGAPPSTAPSATADFGSVFKNLAFFGQGIVNLSERLRLIGGLRYTVDQLDVFHIRRTVLSGPGINPNFDAGVFNNGATNPATGALIPGVSNGVPFRGKATNTNLSGKGGVQFDISRASTAYATYARGYKGPAFNVFFNLTATGTNAIAPETSDAYEVGLKNTFFGGRLVLNLAGYYAKYHNFQANNPDLVAGVVVTRFTNAGTVSTRGGEADLIWRPVRDLNISGGVAYTDAHVDRFLQAPGAAVTAVIPAGTPLAFAPKWKGSLGADYRLRTGGAIDVFVGAQGSYQSKQLTLFSPDAVQRAQGTVHGYGLVNLSAGIGDTNDRFRLTAQVRNLFDESFAATIVNGGPGGAYRYQIPRDADRYYGVTGRVNF